MSELQNLCPATQEWKLKRVVHPQLEIVVLKRVLAENPYVLTLVMLLPTARVLPFLLYSI